MDSSDIDLIKQSKSELMDHSEDNAIRSKSPSEETANNEQVSAKINEAIMLDDVQKLSQLNLTIEQITGFDYHVSIPRQSVGNSQLHFSENQQFSYNFVMLACAYESPNVLRYIWRNHI